MMQQAGNLLWWLDTATLEFQSKKKRKKKISPGRSMVAADVVSAKCQKNSSFQTY